MLKMCSTAKLRQTEVEMYVFNVLSKKCPDKQISVHYVDRDLI